MCFALQAKNWRAYYTFPRCVRDLFATSLQLVGLPASHKSEQALRGALGRYGTLAHVQVRLPGEVAGFDL